MADICELLGPEAIESMTVNELKLIIQKAYGANAMRKFGFTEKSDIVKSVVELWQHLCSVSETHASFDVGLLALFASCIIACGTLILHPPFGKRFSDQTKGISTFLICSAVLYLVYWWVPDYGRRHSTFPATTFFILALCVWVWPRLMKATNKSNKRKQLRDKENLGFGLRHTATLGLIVCGIKAFWSAQPWNITEFFQGYFLLCLLAGIIFVLVSISTPSKD